MPLFTQEEQMRVIEVTLALDGILDEARKAIHDRIEDMWFCFCTASGAAGHIARHWMGVRKLVVEALGEERTQDFIDNAWEKYGEDLVRRDGATAEDWRIYMDGTGEEREALRSRLEEEFYRAKAEVHSRMADEIAREDEARESRRRRRQDEL